MKAAPNASVAIIVVNWNGYEFTRNCLQSLARISQPDFQVILVDNASEDDSSTKLRAEFSHLTLLESEQNLGFTGGNNLGIAHALAEGYDYLLLLNNDTEVEPDFISLCLATLQEDPGIAAVQPLMYYLHDKKTVWNAGGEYRKWMGASISLTQRPISDRPYFTEWITGCCILVKAEVVREVGPLDDRYFAYFEDVDWSLRMRNAGYMLQVVPSAVIYHEAGASLKSKKSGKEGRLNPKIHYLNSRNQIFQLRKHVRFPYSLIAWPYQMGKFSLYSIYFVLRGRKEKLRIMWEGIMEGLGRQQKF